MQAAGPSETTLRSSQRMAAAAAASQRLLARARRRHVLTGAGILVAGILIGANALLMVIYYTSWLPSVSDRFEDPEPLAAVMADPEPEAPDRREWISENRRRLGDALGLTAEQSQDMERMLGEHYEAMRGLNQQAADRRRQLRQDMEELLTPEQMEAWQERARRMAERHPGRPGPGRPPPRRRPPPPPEEEPPQAGDPQD